MARIRPQRVVGRDALLQGDVAPHRRLLLVVAVHARFSAAC
jgi:hypothetical protein